MNVSSENEAVSWGFNVTVLFPHRLFTMRTTKTKSKASGVKLRAMTWQSQKWTQKIWAWWVNPAADLQQLYPCLCPCGKHWASICGTACFLNNPHCRYPIYNWWCCFLFVPNRGNTRKTLRTWKTKSTSCRLKLQSMKPTNELQRTSARWGTCVPPVQPGSSSELTSFGEMVLTWISMVLCHHELDNRGIFPGKKLKILS